jgi:hypothetical protein
MALQRTGGVKEIAGYLDGSFSLFCNLSSVLPGKDAAAL